LQTHFATSEDQIKGYLTEMDDLRKRLRQEEDTSAELKLQLQTIEAQLTEEHEKVGDLQMAYEADKVVVQTSNISK
jgi:chromosome segregation ATPase